MTAAPMGSQHRPTLGTHRLIGGGRGAALVRVTGEIDWWCPNRFEATPLLWSLLDAHGGSARWKDSEVISWDARPAGPTTRSVLDVSGRRVDTWDGLIALGDTSALVRLVRSAVPCTVTHVLRAGGFDGPREAFDGVAAPASERLVVVGGARHRVDGWALETEIDLTPDEWAGLAIVVDSTGQQRVEPAALEGLLAAADESDRRGHRRTRRPHHHPYRALDALCVLEVLTDPETGAPVASPTTSLPEAIGGTRQFDYRYSWLRDSANAVATAALLGHCEAAMAYLHHIAELLRDHGEHLTPVSTTAGQPLPAEREIDGVDGWAGSRPVRVGNKADGQRQMDSVTTVLEAIDVYLSYGGRMTAEIWRTVEQLAGLLVDAPFAPSNGVWEVREPQLLVSEELARWVGLDRAIRIGRRYRPWRRRAEWAAARAAARTRVEGAVDPATGLLPQAFGGDPTWADASALLVVINGFWPPRDPRSSRLVYGTISRLERGAFLRRYPPMDDGFTGTEGCFVPASWWAVSALAIIGDLREAEHRADEMCLHLPPLQPEEWDVDDDQALGNTPLLWSHTESARALYHLHVERIRSRFGSVGVLVWRTFRRARQRLAAFRR